MLLPTRTVAPGESIPNTMTEDIALPTLSGARGGKRGEECMSSSKFSATQTEASSASFYFSQTTANSANEAMKTRGEDAADMM